MPDAKISELPEALSLDGTEDTPVVQSGVTKRAASGLFGSADDITIEKNVGVFSIKDGGVNNAKLADMPANTIKGRLSGGSGDPEDLTVLQAKGLLEIDNVDNTADADKPVSTAQQTAIDDAVLGIYDDKGNYDAATNSPDLDVSPSGIKKGDCWTVSVGGQFFTETVEQEDVVRALQDDPTLLEHWAIMQGNLTSPTIKSKYESNADTNAYTDAEKTLLATIEENADVTDEVNVGASMNSVEAKTTPVDADTLPVNDSEDSNLLKKITWANIKAILKGYFDTLYVALTGDQTIAGTKTFSTPIRLEGLNSGDQIITTDTDGALQESGVKAEATAETGSMLLLIPFVSAPTAPENYDMWIRKDGAQRFIEWHDGGTTYSVEMGAL